MHCPKCGSDNVYNHDKGWNYFLRGILYRSRMVCRECNSTWRKNSPHHFAKLKRKNHIGGKSGLDYHRILWADLGNASTQEEITGIVSGWQESGMVKICLDFTDIPQLELQDRSKLVKISRKLKSIAGDLIVINTNESVTNEIWNFNLGFMLATGQAIKE